MGLTRRDAWTLGALLAAALALLAYLDLGALRPRPFPLVTADPPPPPPRIDLNRASAAELEALPDVGPVLAAALIRHRPFRGPEDLTRVPGLGPRGIERIAARVRFSP